MDKQVELPAYRWTIISISALILAVSMGSIVNGMSAYVVPMQNAYGWDRGEIALINVAGIIGLAAGGLFMGRQADRRGTRPVVMFGILVMGCVYIAASFATALWQFYALMFLAGFFGAAAIFPPIMAAVGNWFPVGAGLAIGIASGGQALGQGGVPFASSFLIEGLGLSGAFAVTGIVMLVFLLPLAALFRQPPSAAKGSAAAQRAADEGYPAARLVIPAMCAAILLCCTCMSVPLMHLVPLIQDRGFGLDEASSVIFVMLMVAIAGRVSFGKLADIIGALPAYMTATAWMGLMVYGFTVLDNLSDFYLYAIVYGFGYAGVMTGVLVSVAALTPPSRRASAMGIVTLFGWLGHANGGYLGGFLYDRTGDYSLAYAIAATAAAVNLAIVGTLHMKTRGPDLKAVGA
ncbi:MAG: MFS transporter [Hyphomicrobiales bacterium]|nr:MFS transporter [Hyphomicrobiales bacterium]